MVADALRGFVGGGEGLDAFRSVGGHHADNLRRVDFHYGAADAVGGFVDGYFAAVRRVEAHVVVVEPAERCFIIGAVLDDDFFGHLRECGGHAYAGAEDKLAVGRHLCNFDYGYVDGAVETVTEVLRHVAQVHVEVVHPVVVGKVARILVALVRSAHVDGVGAGQLAVHMVVGRRSREQVDFEWFAFLMEFLGALGQGYGYNFRRS